MIQSQTLDFLKNIKLNNNKPWFEEHKSQYLSARENMEQFVADLLHLFPTIDSEIHSLKPSDCLFRIYRDVRFSKDKTPYKINMSAAFHKGGKKSGYGGYYIHIQPGGNSFIGGGLWSPSAENVKKVRQEIDYNWPEFESIIHSKHFQKTFGTLERDKDQVLQNPPRGYEKDHPAIEYLKLKSWVVSQNISDKELMKNGVLKQIATSFKTLSPFLHFLNRALD